MQSRVNGASTCIGVTAVCESCTWSSSDDDDDDDDDDLEDACLSVVCHRCVDKNTHDAD